MVVSVAEKATQKERSCAHMGRSSLSKETMKQYLRFFATFFCGFVALSGWIATVQALFDKYTKDKNQVWILVVIAVVFSGLTSLTNTPMSSDS